MSRSTNSSGISLVSSKSSDVYIPSKSAPSIGIDAGFDPVAGQAVINKVEEEWKKSESGQ